jgi:broad specificity phosphatase PhoE
MSRLYLIRHGRPAAGWGEDDDPGLDETGKAQARAVAERLMNELERPLAVVSSPLRRCRETAEPLARALGVDVEIDPAVGEIPTPKGLTARERPGWLREAMSGAWWQIRGDIDYALWRVDVLDAIRRRPDTAVFSHFVAINAVVSALAGQDQVIAFRPDHVSVTTLSLEPSGLRVVERGAQATTRVL